MKTLHVIYLEGTDPATTTDGVGFTFDDTTAEKLALDLCKQNPEREVVQLSYKLDTVTRRKQTIQIKKAKG